jgi:Asp-tRNA(Asn)/Glu-tRNA(Gln) amidotransferase A subunit family amidase
LTGTLFIDPIRKFRLLTTARPMTRSLADLRLMLQVISGPDGQDPEVPPVPWRQARPMKLTGLQAAYSPGFPPSVAGEIRAGTEALAVELDKPGVIIENWLPGPTLAGDRQFADELSSMLALAAEASRARVG